MTASLWGFYRSSIGTLAWCVALSALQSLLVLPLALLLRQVFDAVHVPGNAHYLIAAGAGMLVLQLLSNWLTWVSKSTALHVTKTAIRQLREQLLERICGFSHAYYTQTDRSRLHASIVHD